MTELEILDDLMQRVFTMAVEVAATRPNHTQPIDTQWDLLDSKMAEAAGALAFAIFLVKLRPERDTE